MITHPTHPLPSHIPKPTNPLQPGANSRPNRLPLGLRSESRNAEIPSLQSKPVAPSSITQECVNGFGTQKSLRDMKLKDTLLCLQSIGAGYARSFANNPSTDPASLENTQNVLHYLRWMGLTNKEVGKIFQMHPQVMSSSPEGELRPVFNFLLGEVKMSGTDIPKVINRCPRLLKCRVEEQLRPTLCYLVRLGFKDLHLPTCQNSFLLASSVEEKLIPKIEYMKSMGLTHREAVKIVKRFPAFFGYSIANNVKPKFEYLVNEMGGSVDDLKEFPQYFAFSLQKRIRPRHLFLLQNNIRLPLSVMLMTNDVDFYGG